MSEKTSRTGVISSSTATRGFALPDRLAHLAHRGHRSPHVVVRPDHHGNPGVPERLCRRAVIHGRHDYHRRPATPGLAEAGDLVGGLLLGVDQHRVGAGPVIGLGPAQRLIHAPAGDQRLDARHDLEVVVALAVLARLDAAAELVHVRQRLVLADEGVGLGEELVLDADPPNATLAQLPHQAPHVVEVAVAGVAVHEDRDRGGVGHELQHFEDLGPGGLRCCRARRVRPTSRGPRPRCPRTRPLPTILAESPLCASMMKERAGAWSRPRKRAALDIVAACASALPIGSLVAMGNRRFVARSSMNLTYRGDIKG